MFSTPEYAFRRNKKITTVFRGEKTIWANREEAKDYILEAMMTAESEVFFLFYFLSPWNLCPIG